MINKTINGYTIKHLIGSGGMADVYYAENKLGKKAAIKVLKSELCAIGTIKERFEQEARIMVDVEHKNIRQAYDLDEVNGQPAIIMEYLEGHTLKQLIDKGKLTDAKAQKYFEQCVLALKLTHAKEIVHRDIKPSNIFITRDDEVKILDFGIAKLRETSLSTMTNQMLGTPVYMSPEQVKSPKNVDTKSDVYSLAVTFYHALTGKVPYDSTTDSDFEIQSKIVHEDLDLSKVSSSWRDILRTMLTKDPNQRVDLNYVGAISGNERRDDYTRYDILPSKAKPNSDMMTISSTKPTSKNLNYYLWGGGLLGFIVILSLRQFGSNAVARTYIEPFEVVDTLTTDSQIIKKLNLKMIDIPGRNIQISETEITIGQYLEFCDKTNSHWPHWLEKGNEYNIYTGTNKYYSKIGMSESNSNHPITGVSALDADAFCKWKGGRLPTEQEWEYAAKGGEDYEYSGSDNLDPIAWYNRNSGSKTHRVRSRAPNGYGLYDMRGNVWEWTSSKEGTDRVFRGGSWRDSEVYFSFSFRLTNNPTFRNYSIGFRLAR